MGWILALRDLLLYGGDLDFAARQLPKVRFVLDRCLEAVRATSEKLLPAPSQPDCWNFYEWTTGGNEALIPGKIRFDAVLNCYLVLALRAAAFLLRETGQQEDDYLAAADDIADRAHSFFWDGGQGAYRNYSEGYPLYFTELAQSLALLAGLPSAGEAAALRERLAAGGQFVELTVCYKLYKYQALMQQPERYADVSKTFGFNWI
jgi:hypothetical protein